MAGERGGGGGDDCNALVLFSHSPFSGGDWLVLPSSNSFGTVAFVG